MASFHLSAVLRWASLAVLLGVASLIVWHFQIPPSPPSVSIPVEPPPATGAPADGENATLPAQVVEETVRFEAVGESGGRRAFVLRADRTVTLREEEMQLEGVDLDLYRADGDPIRVTAREGVHRARTGEVRLEGGVQVRRGDDLVLNSEVLEFRPGRPSLVVPVRADFAAGQVTGHGAGLEYFTNEDRIEIEGPVFLRVESRSGLAEDAIEGRGWHMTYLPGVGRARLREDAVLTRAGGRLRGWDVMLAGFADPGGTALVVARSGVEAGRIPEDGHGQLVRADRLEARLGGGGGWLEEARWDGAVRASDGTRRGEAETAVHRAATSETRFEGGAAGSPVAMVSAPGRLVRAPRIEVRKGGAILAADGGVETVLEAGAGGAPGLGWLSRTGEPIRVRSDRLSSSDAGERAFFSGSVLALQGERQVLAQWIRVQPSGMEAGGGVVTRFPSGSGNPAERNPDPSKPPITIRADRMGYDRRGGVLRYEGGARLDHGPARGTCDTVVVDLVPGGEAIERVRLEGTVHLEMESQTAAADHGVYFPREDRLVLTRDAGFVELHDRAEGRQLRSRQLTFLLSGDSMAAEIGARGRSWITLNPGRGEADSLGADARD